MVLPSFKIETQYLYILSLLYKYYLKSKDSGSFSEQDWVLL